MRSSVQLALGVPLLLAAACSAVDPFSAMEDRLGPSRGAVVSEHPLATRAGLRVLESGGNAADAAVAAALTLAVVYPQAGNLGGGGFAVWVPGEGPAETLDFREVAPAGYTADLYLDEHGEVVPARSLRTPLAVGVPGSPKGLFELYRSHGSRRLSFTQVCETAILLAENGFRVDAWLAASLRRGSVRKLLSADPGAAALFYPGGEPLAEGAVLVQPALAKTLRSFALGGPDGFYSGDVGRAIVADLAEADVRTGGAARASLMTRADLRAYRAVWRPPIIGRFAGREVIGMGPPSSGGVALAQILGILQGLPLETARRAAVERVAMGVNEEPAMGRMGLLEGDEALPTPGAAGVDARALHWWIEAMRCAFADRAAHLGDPDHVDVPVEALLSPGWISRRRVGIGDQANLEVGAWVAPVPDGSDETTHLSVVDREGNAVSLTTTLNASYGSGIFVDEGGFLLNNELDDFSIQAGVPNMYGLVGAEANQLAPGRRPLSSMTPVVVRGPDGRVEMAIGAPGGPRIITSVLQVMLRVLVYGQDLSEAVRAPRLHQQWRPETTRFEGTFDAGLIDRLRREHGQPVSAPEVGRFFGSVQAILVAPDGSVEAVSDPRRGGAGGVQGRGLSTPAAVPGG